MPIDAFNSLVPEPPQASKEEHRETEVEGMGGLCDMHDQQGDTLPVSSYCEMWSGWDGGPVNPVELPVCGKNSLTWPRESLGRSPPPGIGRTGPGTAIGWESLPFRHPGPFGGSEPSEAQELGVPVPGTSCES
jgi:hypothetical protein